MTSIVEILPLSTALLRWHLRRNLSRELTSLVNTTRLNLDFLISAPNLVFCTAIESPDRVLYIPANGVFQNLVVVERAVAESVAD